MCPAAHPAVRNTLIRGHVQLFDINVLKVGL